MLFKGYNNVEVISKQVHFRILTWFYRANAPNTPMPGWLVDRIKATGSSLKPRYEASLYGPINTLLTWRFPAHRQFMVKPQGKIRPHYATDDADLGEEGMARLSLDSYRSEVLPRGMIGREQGVMVPDFILTKASASLNADRVLAVVEVKPSDMDDLAALGQLGEYLGMFQDKVTVDGQPLFATLYGLLVIGHHVIILTVEGPGAAPKESQRYDITSQVVHNFLETIAAENW
jgi:hypothetical protein